MAKAERDATEVENAQRLDKLPREVWEKILDLLDENDLLPLALSCRNFRQKQKELVARTKKRWPRGHKFRFALRTKLKQKIKKGQPASLEYLKFCSKDKVAPKTRQQLRPALGKNVVRKRAREVRALASFHGHLPLLQEALSGVKGGARVMHELIDSAGEFFFSLQSRLMASDLFLSFSSSKCAEAKWRSCSGCQPKRTSRWIVIALPVPASTAIWRY